MKKGRIGICTIFAAALGLVFGGAILGTGSVNGAAMLVWSSLPVVVADPLALLLFLLILGGAILQPW